MAWGEPRAAARIAAFVESRCGKGNGKKGCVVVKSMSFSRSGRASSGLKQYCCRSLEARQLPSMLTARLRWRAELPTPVEAKPKFLALPGRMWLPSMLPSGLRWQMRAAITRCG